VWSELRERVARYDSRTSDMRLPDSVRSFLMFRRGSNPCECNVFILELKLNVRTEIECSLCKCRKSAFETHANEANMVASMRAHDAAHARTSGARLGGSNLDTKEKRHRERLGITTCH
jgi:hypothetical protein